ncbi:hypothetical protein SAMN05421780_1203 [Flexibacter flexilis DSM 6793]|uniref:Colicin import membrane protein n=1 Tax=Flexibacter flexilis DSM 6793 TaxID=927664 RepID=A0A1I1NUT3_9BACT|nr:hypothetical protein [Flexibacter flexilis]SFD01195.1 hypothetical protein SAMN05421780_1203 [Flexibacter flexilis DSM 6793]
MKAHFIILLAVFALMGTAALGQTNSNTAAPVIASNAPQKGENTALAGKSPHKNIVFAKLDSLVAVSKAKAAASAKQAELSARQAETSEKELALTKEESQATAKQAEKSAKQAEISAKQAKIAQEIATQLTKVSK